MSLDSSIIKVECSCGNTKELNRQEQIDIFNEEIKIVDLSKYYEKFSCQKCKKKFPKTFDKNNNLLFDPENLKKCKTCNNYISVPRLQTGVNVLTCSPYCEYSIIETEETIARAQKYLEDFNENLKKLEIAETKTKNNLERRKYTIITAYKKMLAKEISAKEYEKLFKEFTWEIKTQIEPMGGKLIDDPRKYINCAKCGAYSVILWTSKYKKYFIGCSQYSSGCKWAKSVWKM